MQDDANEFVAGNFTSRAARLSNNACQFRRKRKRLRALDPQEAPAEAVAILRNDPLHSGLIPEIAVLPELATSSPALPDDTKSPSPKRISEKIVTVETFLRRSAQTNPKTKQAVPGADLPSGSRAYTRHGPAERRTTRVQKVKKASKESRDPPSRIAKSLYRAAVLTDGDPLDALVDDDAGASHTRHPLKFVPFNKFAEPVGPNKPDSTGPSEVGRSEDTVQRTRRHHDGKTSGLKFRRDRQTSQARAPLQLIPFREAEVAYSVMFPSQRVL